MYVCIYIFYIFRGNLIAMSRGFVSGGERYSFFVLRDAETQFHAVGPCSRLWLIIWTCPRRPQSSYSGNARLARCLGRFGKSVSEVRCKKEFGTHFGKKFALILHTGPGCWVWFWSSWYMLVPKCHCWCNLQVLRSDQICYSADPTLKENVAGMTWCPYAVLMTFSALLQL